MERCLSAFPVVCFLKLFVHLTISVYILPISLLEKDVQMYEQDKLCKFLCLMQYWLLIFKTDCFFNYIVVLNIVKSLLHKTKRAHLEEGTLPFTNHLNYYHSVVG